MHFIGIPNVPCLGQMCSLWSRIANHFFQNDKCKPCSIDKPVQHVSQKREINKSNEFLCFPWYVRACLAALFLDEKHWARILSILRSLCFLVWVCVCMWTWLPTFLTFVHMKAVVWEFKAVQCYKHPGVKEHIVLSFTVTRPCGKSHSLLQSVCVCVCVCVCGRA